MASWRADWTGFARMEEVGRKRVRARVRRRRVVMLYVWSVIESVVLFNEQDRGARCCDNLRSGVRNDNFHPVWPGLYPLGMQAGVGVKMGGLRFA